MTEILCSPKIKPEHLARKAIVYLRQSSEKQVRQNLESQRLQYEMAVVGQIRVMPDYGCKRAGTVRGRSHASGLTSRMTTFCARSAPISGAVCCSTAPHAR